MLALDWLGSKELERMPRVLRVRDPHAGWRRCQRRHFARAQRQIEQSAQYQQELAKLSELASYLRAELSATAHERWLDLEEALLAHVAQMARIYFRAGFAQGAASAQRRAARDGDALLRQLSELLNTLAKTRSR